MIGFGCGREQKTGMVCSGPSSSQARCTLENQRLLMRGLSAPPRGYSVCECRELRADIRGT